MRYFVGIDVSQRQVSICVLDQEGKRLWRGKCQTVNGGENWEQAAE